MIYSTFFQFLTGVYNAFLVNEFYGMLVTRLLYGLFNGLTLPLSYIIISEIIPLQNRGKANIIPVLFEIVGRWYCIMLGGIFMESRIVGNW